MRPWQQLQNDIHGSMLADRHRLLGRFRALREENQRGKPVDGQFERLAEDARRSAAQCRSRRSAVPRIAYDNQLPISAKRGEIAGAIADNQVVIVCGETGSGKSTQLPKICLEMGRGVEGLIGHTQPRRIAARSVAARIAEELGSPLGRDVGYKVRFAEAVGPRTFIKLMTDGLLLAETQADPFLNQYDTIILDEAHERSLNIDFLIGYLKRLLAKRRDLKLIVTSATIDAARFSAHFAAPARPAPVIEVSGRAYPVETLWRPLTADEEGGEPDPQEAVLAAVRELSRIERGDILIFMPTERHIHETAKTLRDALQAGNPAGQDVDILPLYARLSIQEQQRVFQPGPKRRIVIATNVAESSLTVPRIHFVIDPGTARISRYSPRSKTQRLPIEPVSQASADQRKGRCGRIGPGVCVRLFSEEDYNVRNRYTVPEIQRTNLASVILQTKALQLGPIERFPFLDPPKNDAVRDGYRTLFEIGALDQNGELTPVGRQLSRLPVDPRIGRMILAAAAAGCLPEVLVIASALEVQDPRERPLDKQEAADACHASFSDERSDFIGHLKLWEFYHKLKNELSRNQLRKACRQNFLSFNRMREWLDIHRELMGLVAQTITAIAEKPGAAARTLAKPAAIRRDKLGRMDKDQYGAIHRSILTGLLSNLAMRGDGYEYSVAGGGKANLWPGSCVFQSKPRWVVAAEVVETTRRYLRCCAQIERRWIEPLAEHLVKRTYHGVHWEPAAASAMALERVTLFGLTLEPGRRVAYGPVDPAASRHLLIEQGLVGGHIEPKAEFLLANMELVRRLERLQEKLRRRDLLVGEWPLYEFYDQRVPADVYDGPRVARWSRENPGALGMTKEHLLREPVGDDIEAGFPDVLDVGRLKLPLTYRFEPGAEDDGVTLEAPLEALNQIDGETLDWLVPGLLEAKTLAMIRSLPKQLRTLFVPAPETAKRAAASIAFGVGGIRAALAETLSRLGGSRVAAESFQMDRLPPELRMNVRVVGAEGNTLISGRDLAALRRELGVRAAEIFQTLDDPQWHRDGLTAWEFGDLPESVELNRRGLTLKAYPALLDREESVSLRLLDSPRRADDETRRGLRRLCYLAAKDELKLQIDWLPKLDRARLWTATIAGFDPRRQLGELLADRAFLGDAPIPRAKADFHRLLAAGRERIGMAVQDVLETVWPIFEGFHQTCLAVEQIPKKYDYVIDDVGEQLRWLTGFISSNNGNRVSQPTSTGKTVDKNEPATQIGDPFPANRFLTATPWNWLRQYPRYLRAIRIRLETLAGSAARDRQCHEQFSPWWRLLVEQSRQRQFQGFLDPELIQMRWMLEEYRVSLFAQRLGTSMPVSSKRLEALWAKAQQIAP
jgi:ATP-dependent helicase HrpA